MKKDAVRRLFDLMQRDAEKHGFTRINTDNSFPRFPRLILSFPTPRSSSSSSAL
jgi:hypothetical protein